MHAVPGKALTPEKLEEQDRFIADKLDHRVKEAARGERDFFLWMPPTLSTKRS